MVPTELLVTAMIGGFTIAATAIVAMVRVLGSRISEVRGGVQDLRRDVGGRFDALEMRFASIDTRIGVVQDDLTTVRASLGAIDARLATLEQR